VALWQEILTDYGDACYFMSFSELAEEYGTTERSAYQAIAAIGRKGAICGSVIIASIAAWSQYRRFPCQK
jgi:hypothetical protein